MDEAKWSKEFLTLRFLAAMGRHGAWRTLVLIKLVATWYHFEGWRAMEFHHEQLLLRNFQSLGKSRKRSIFASHKSINRGYHQSLAFANRETSELVVSQLTDTYPTLPVIFIIGNHPYLGDYIEVTGRVGLY